jgi:multiple sugar transport system substrate-binding protein
MRKLYLPVLALFILLATQSKNLAQEDINLSISCTCTDILAAWFDEVVIPSFVAQEAEKGKTVSVELIDYEFSGEEYREHLAVEFGANSGTDVSTFDGFWIAEFAETGLLLPLNEVVGEDVDTWDGWEFLGVQGNITYKGERYGVPEGTDVRVIFYRRDLFEQAGISLPWQPHSWAELLSTAQTLKDNGIAYPLQLDAGTYMGEATTMQGYFMLLLGAGAHIYDFETQVWVIDEAAHLHALNFFKTVYVDEQLGNLDFQLTEDGRNASFLAMREGEIGMYIEGDYLWRSIMNPNNNDYGIQERDELVAWAQMPAIEAGDGYRGQDYVTISGGNGYVINPNTPYPQEAWELMQVIVGREAGQARQDYETRVLARLDVEITGDTVLEEMVDMMLPISTSRPLLPEYPLVSYEMQWMTEMVITGAATPEEALADFEANVADIVGAENLVILPID